MENDTSDKEPLRGLGPNNIINGRYRIINEIGSGGMGTVYLVEDISRENIKIVLKVLQSTQRIEEEIEGLRREFRTLATFRHPNLVRVFDFGKLADSDDYFFTMEYVDGQEFFKAIKTASVDDILPLFSQVMQALDYIHAAGVYHGDLKSENILVADDSEGKKTIKLLDFGLSSTQVKKKENQISGTLEYLSPERFRGAALSIKTDLYAAGILMYWALTNKPPFAGTPDEIKTGHLTKTPEQPSKVNPDIPDHISSLIMRLIAKDPNERYTSSEEVLVDTGDKKGVQSIISDLITPRIWDAFIDTKSSQIEDLFKNMLSVLEKIEKQSPESSPHFFSISGNEGSGHDQILDDIKYRLQLGDIKVYEGWCWVGLNSPYQPIIDAFKSDNLITTDILNIYGDSVGIEGAPSNENLTKVSDDHIKDPELLRFKFMEMVSENVSAACQKEPIVLIIRNIEFADEGTVDLLYYLSRVLDQKKFVTCISNTVDKLSEEMAAIIQQQNTSLKATMDFNLQPLNEEEIIRLLQTAFTPISITKKFYRELLEKSGGIPLIIADTLTELNKAGFFRRSDGVWAMREDYDLDAISPAGIEGLYQKTIENLTESQKTIVRLVAVYNSAINTDTLSKLLGWEKKDVDNVVASLIQKRILVADSFQNSPNFDFLSNSMKETCYKAIPDQERRDIHIQIVDEIENNTLLGIPIEQKAYHYLKAGISKKAMHYCAQAYNKLKRANANRRALFIIKEALAQSEGISVRFRRAFLRRAADMEEMLGDTEKALHDFTTVAKSYRSGVAKAAILRRISSLYQRLGDLDKSKEILNQALQELTSQPNIEQALITRELSWLAIIQGQHKQSQELGESALDILDPSNPSRALALTLNTLGINCFYAGEKNRAIEYFNRSAAVKKAIGDERSMAATLNNIGAAFNVVGNRKDAMNHWQTSLEIRERIGDICGLAETLNNFGILLSEQGQYSRSLHMYKRSRDLQHRIGDVKGLIDVLCNLGELEFIREKYSSAMELLDEGLVYTERIQASRQQAELLYQLARVFLAINQKEKAQKYIDQCLSIAESNGSTGRLGVYYAFKSKERRLAGNSSSDDFLAKAKDIYDSEKEHVLETEVELEHIEQLLIKGQNEGIISELQNLLKKVESTNSPWYKVQVLILFAKVTIQMDSNTNHCKTILDTAEKIAETLGLMTQTKQINILKGYLYRKLGKPSIAFQCYRKAYQCLKAVVIEIFQDEYKKSFLAMPENINLLKEIKALKTVLSK